MLGNKGPGTPGTPQVTERQALSADGADKSFKFIPDLEEHLLKVQEFRQKRFMFYIASLRNIVAFELDLFIVVFN